MKQTHNSKILFGFMCLAISACGSNATNSGTTTRNSVPNGGTYRELKISEALLQGKWSDGCHADPYGESIYIEEIIEFSNGEVKRTIVKSLDSNCFQRLFEMQYRGMYLIGTESGRYSESRKSIKLTPLTPFAVSLFQARGGLCGAQDWALRQPKEFKEIGKCGFPSVVNGSVHFTEAPNGEVILGFNEGNGVVIASLLKKLK